jgi:hypothetical protein
LAKSKLSSKIKRSAVHPVPRGLRVRLGLRVQREKKETRAIPGSPVELLRVVNLHPKPLRHPLDLKKLLVLSQRRPTHHCQLLFSRSEGVIASRPKGSGTKTPIFAIKLAKHKARLLMLSVKPKLKARVRHLSGSGYLRHATVRGVV